MTTASSAPASGRNQQEEWAADGTLLAFVVRGAILVAFGWFVGGLVGAGVALAGVLATWLRPTALVSACAAAMLVAAAFATVFEVTPTNQSLRSNFAIIRPVAADCGLAAGILAIVAVATAAMRERSLSPAPAATPAAGEAVGAAEPAFSWTKPWAALSSPEIRARAEALLPYAGVILATLVVRAVAAPTAVPGAMHQLIANLRDGDGYVLGTAGHFHATGGPSPIPSLLGAFAPGGATLSLVVTSVAVVSLVMAAVYRVADRSTALLAGIAVLVLQVATVQRLPETVAGAALLLGFVLAEGERSVSTRTIFAGVAAGLAIMSVPWALVGLALLLAWIVAGQGARNAQSVGAALSTLVAAGLTVIPWSNFLRDKFATVAPSTTMAPGLASATEFIPVLVAAAAILSFRRRA